MIVLHHLNYSRSTRILWALEELELPFRLVRHDRTEQFRAPVELAAIHPLGKAPVIEDDGLVLAESAVILTHINTRHGGGRLAPPAGTEAHARHEEWLHYVESTAAFPIMTMVIGARTGGLPERFEAFMRSPLGRTLDHIATAVGRSPYLMGDALMLADIQMSYTLEMANHAGLLAGHAPIADYLSRFKARPAFARAVAIGGPMTPPA